MFVLYVEIVQRVNIMEQLVVMDVKDFLGEVSGKITHIRAGKHNLNLNVKMLKKYYS